MSDHPTPTEPGAADEPDAEEPNTDEPCAEHEPLDVDAAAPGDSAWADEPWDPALVDDDDWPATGMAGVILAVLGTAAALTWYLMAVAWVLSLFGLGIALRARRIRRERGDSLLVPRIGLWLNGVLVTVVTLAVFFQVAFAPLFRG